ncbi:ALDH-like protein [Melanomma pulvis-pyrius CBS 109.77]|uniref:ALDH-like protein n=1 Tax=Melanomma pulvis-pyrius CBS 109.77 TaxID=1314802 RepID=A0A6A6XPZ8_9PLEO|nr:ALDH-like protein [Melanomma pulvis-pyrius CBS 109.77]
MSRTLQAVREAAIDGRLRNVIYRQSQLEKLQKVFVENAEAAEKAIRKDSGNSNSEAAVEFILTLQAIKAYYETLDETEALRSEYALARGEDAAGRQDGIGIVYIVPTNYTLFYSVVVATSAAIAAGNCVVIEFRTPLQELPLLLQKLLKIALDPSTVEFVTSRASDDDLGPNHIRVIQNNTTAADQQPLLPTIYSPLISLPESRVVAIVDRGVDFANTAAALVTARFGFGGNSPYAPDVVLVHEYVKKEFLIAVVEEMVKFTANGSVLKPVEQERAEHVKRLLESGQKSGEIQVTSSTIRGSVYEVKDRNTEVLRNKINGTSLVVLGVRSLDDAINLANQSGNLLASYIWAAPTSAKYLSQFVQTQASFVNQVPLEFLVGPAAPRFSFIDRSLRYPVKLLSAPHAEYATRHPNSDFVHKCLQDTDTRGITKTLKEISVPLSPKSVRSDGGQIGFFEQGIFIGLGIFGIPTVLTIGALGFYGIRIATRWVRY